MKFFLLMALMILNMASTLAALPKIGFVLATLQEERYQKDQKYFKEEAAKLGFEPIFVSADNNEQTQASKVENLLSSGVAALVIQPVNSKAASTMVKRAHEDKVPVIAYDRLINDAPVDVYVTMDSFKVGVLQAEAAVKATKEKGNYIILMGQAGHSVAEEITRGVLSVLAKYPQIKVVVQKSHDSWSPELAMQTVENALTANKNNIQAILANNSGMAKGAVQAVSEQSLAGKIFIAGADADLAAIRDIVNGKQQFEVLKDISALAKRAAQVAFGLSQGKQPKDASSMKSGAFTISMVATPVYPINKDNIEEKIIKSGFHTREAVYKK